MTTASKPVTAEELLAMGKQARWLELHEGELRQVSPANMRHGYIAVRIASILHRFVEERNLGYIGVEGGFILQRNPDTVLGPDISFLRRERAPDGLPEKFFEGFPDLAVEIISPRNPRVELERKMRFYISHGAPLAWLVDPNDRSIEIYAPNLPVRRLQQTDIIDGNGVLPGFSCSVADFFA